MTRQSAWWTVAGIGCLLLAVPPAGAQSDRPGGDDRPAARAGDEGPRGKDRERPKFVERREQPDRGQAEDRDRDGDRQRPGQRMRAEAQRGDQPAPGPRGAEPKMNVIRLQHISAEAYMQVFKQLCHNPAVGDALSKVPVAMCEQANAIVVLGPPEAQAFFHELAAGLDQPSEFHQRMRAREMEMRRQEAEMRQRFGPVDGPTRGGMQPGGPQGGMHGMPMGPGPGPGPGPGFGGPGRGMTPPPGGPMGGMRDGFQPGREGKGWMGRLREGLRGLGMGRMMGGGTWNMPVPPPQQQGQPEGPMTGPRQMGQGRMGMGMGGGMGMGMGRGPMGNGPMGKGPMGGAPMGVCPKCQGPMGQCPKCQGPTNNCPKCQGGPGLCPKCQGAMGGGKPGQPMQPQSGMPSGPDGRVPMPGQPMPSGPMPGQPMPGQPTPGGPMSGQPMPGQPMSGGPTPGQPMPGGGPGMERRPAGEDGALLDRLRQRRQAEMQGAKPASPSAGPNEPRKPQAGPGGEGQAGEMRMVDEALMDPGMPVVKRLLSPPLAERLRLERQQVEKIEQAAAAHRQSVDQLRQRLAHALKDADPKDRQAVLQKMVQGARARIEQLTGELRQRIGEVLTGDQREALERALRPGEGQGGDKPKGEPNRVGPPRGEPGQTGPTETPQATPTGCGGGGCGGCPMMNEEPQ